VHTHSQNIIQLPSRAYDDDDDIVREINSYIKPPFCLCMYVLNTEC